MIIMLVKYILWSRPCFVFDAINVPAEHYLTYGVDTAIYDYLINNLRPSDINSVRIVTDGDKSYVAVYYRLSDDLLINMPSFVVIDVDDDDDDEDY